MSVSIEIVIADKLVSVARQNPEAHWSQCFEFRAASRAEARRLGKAIAHTLGLEEQPDEQGYWTGDVK